MQNWTMWPDGSFQMMRFCTPMKSKFQSISVFGQKAMLEAHYNAFFWVLIYYKSVENVKLRVILDYFLSTDPPSTIDLQVLSILPPTYLPSHFLSSSLAVIVFSPMFHSKNNSRMTVLWQAPC